LERLIFLNLIKLIEIELKQEKQNPFFQSPSTLSEGFKIYSIEQSNNESNKEGNNKGKNENKDSGQHQKKDLNASQYHSRIVLTTYPGQIGINPIPLKWGANDPLERGPIVASRLPDSMKVRNAIGAHGGSYSIYRALAIAIGDLSATHKPDFHNSEPPVQLGPHPSWVGDQIVSLDPWGHLVMIVFKEYLKNGLDIRPTIAITKAHMRVPELEVSIKQGTLKIDNNIVLPNGDLNVVKGAVEPVWYLPGVAKRFKVDETSLRRALL
jgi:hypothetical protein